MVGFVGFVEFDFFDYVGFFLNDRFFVGFFSFDCVVLESSICVC